MHCWSRDSCSLTYSAVLNFFIPGIWWQKVHLPWMTKPFHLWSYEISTHFLTRLVTLLKSLLSALGYMSCLGSLALLAVFVRSHFFNITLTTNLCKSHCSLPQSRKLFWLKWPLGQLEAALNFKSFWRAMEQSGANKNGMGGIPTSLGAQNTIQICQQMRLDLTGPNSLIWLPCLAGVAER